MTRRTSSRRLPLIAWNKALCSESTGSTVAPAAAARRMNRSPAQTRVSLLASATMAPRSAAASVGLSPAAPVIAPITHSAGRCAASTTASSPAAASMPVPASASLRFAIGCRIGDRGEARVKIARHACKRGSVLACGHCLDPISAALAPEQIDGARADRAGRARARLRCARPSGGHWSGSNAAYAARRHWITTPAGRGPAPRSRHAADQTERQPRRRLTKPSRRSISPP